MRKSLLLLALLLCAVAATAQGYYPEQPLVLRPSRTLYPDQVGLKVDLMNGLGRNAGPEIYTLTAEYTHYTLSDIGYRIGLKVGFSDVETYGLPMHFTWRTGIRRHSRWQDWRNSEGYYVFPFEQPRADGDTHRYYYNPYHTLHTEGLRSAASEVGGAIINSASPIVFDLYGGLTPMYINSSKSRDDSFGLDYTLQRRFACTLDVGGRAMFHLNRWGIFFDMGYRLMLTNNFRQSDKATGRHYFSFGTGVVCRF